MNTRGTMRLFAVLSLCAVLTILAASTVSFAFDDAGQTFGEQGFGSGSQLEENWTGSSFSAEDTPDGMEATRFAVPARAAGAPAQSYFFHLQPLKLIAVLSVVAIAAILLTRRRANYRSLVLLGSVVVLGFLLGGFLCPLAAVQNVLARWYTGYLVLFVGGIVLPALLLGRVFCGWVCPFGAAQELLRVQRFARRVPAPIQRYLTYVPYALLGYLVISVLATGNLILLDYTPFKALFVWDGFSLPLLVTAAGIGISVFVFRPFCRYVCPLGALLGLLSKLGLCKVRFDVSCAGCGRCSSVCPVDALDVHGRRVHSSACIVCGRCIERCPGGSLALARKSRGERAGKTRDTDALWGPRLTSD